MIKLTTGKQIMRLAAFSPDRKYRYALWRIWDSDKPMCMFIGLNPSKADEHIDDPTVRRCMSFAHDWDYGSLCMMNLFAFVSTDPHALCGNDAIGLENDDWLAGQSAYAGIVVASWGNFKVARERAKVVREMIPILYCLGTTKEGQPKHPLYLLRETKPEKYIKEIP